MFCAIPISTITIPMPSADRSSIIFRPLRSARLPQKGAAMAENRNVILNTRPDHMFNDWWPLTPNSSTYSGKNGMIKLNAAPVKKQPNQVTNRFLFQSTDCGAEVINYRLSKGLLLNKLIALRLFIRRLGRLKWQQSIRIKQLA
ncbi:hypothetical protein DJ62_952 [Yersinia enterocolitica]|uniref:Uncharacterized protein n=1 Tax=Yersinia enterocolitica W22703 TaxID=913028 RepID=F4N0P4_YEREN|nr:hypothetical protein DJ62_952 [Yersinia enterocolitica]CBX71652.1 unknown protein [Yersinia enterocolitica W22703]